MRLLYFGDRHNRVTAPENRIDNYHESMKAKDLEITEIGKKYDVRAYLQPGDFWDTPNPPLDFASETIKRWANVDVFDLLGQMMNKAKITQDLMMKEYLRDIMKGKFVSIEEAQKRLHDVFSDDDFKDEISLLQHKLSKDYKPLIGIAGNHELFGNNLNTLPKTMLGFMEKLGLMKFATKENPYFFTTEDGLKVAITGTHYHIDIDSPECINDYVVEEKLGDIHIHMVHGYLTDKSKGDMFRHTLIDQIKHTKADLTITGHDHIGFPITEVDGKFFVNTGAIPRLSNDLKEMNRQVKVLLIDITKEKGLQLKEIPLKSAVDGKLVLNRTKIVERKKKEVRLEEFKKAVRDAGVKKATDITEIVRDIADNRKLAPEIKSKVIERISEKMRIMKAVEDGVVKEAYINKIILENFQSHGYTEIDCSKGFNIFVGESKQGKSAVLRALRWVYENKPSGKRIIRLGAEYARVTVYLSNGYIISRYIEAKRGGKNGYEITDPNTGEVEFNNTKILPEVQKLLGFSPLYIDKDLQFNLNFLKQGDGWFLIGDQYSAPQKAKIIGGIYGTQYADAVIRDIDSETKRTNEKLKNANEVLISTEERLEKFDYLTDLKKSIENVEKIVKEIEELKAKREKIDTLLNKREQITKNISENDRALKGLKHLDKSYMLLVQAKEEESKRNRIEELLGKYEKTSYSLKHLYRSLGALIQLDKGKEIFQHTKELFIKRNEIEKVIVKREGIVNQVQQEEMIIDKTEKINKARRLINNLNKGFEKRNSIEHYILKHEKLVIDINQQNQLLNRMKQLNQASLLFHEIQEKMNLKKEIMLKVKRAEELEIKREKSRKSLQAIHLTLDKTKNVDSMKDKLEELKDVLILKENMEKLLINRDKTIQNIQNEERLIKESKTKILKDIQLYQEALEEAGKCPVCFGTVDKATINRIVLEYSQH